MDNIFKVPSSEVAKEKEAVELHEISIYFNFHQSAVFYFVLSAKFVNEIKVAVISIMLQ